MTVMTTMAVLLAVVLAGCASQQAVESKVVSEREARQLAVEHVNAEFKGHVWKTAIGERAFHKMSPEDWFLVEIGDTSILLKRSGRNGQEFTVSMNLDGTSVKVLEHGFATR
ncbi:MAG: hypothetical protein HQ559_06465 [Lentisphaerae bacterium]|nr:hypothetical protein [Lentisphaerota bacterium]